MRTRKELKRGLNEVLMGIFQTALFPFKVNIVEILESHRPKIVEDIKKSMGNAILESTLIHLRALDDFFDCRPKPNRHEDDMRAYEFGYNVPNARFLDEQQRIAINKRMAHLSWERSKEFKGHHVVKHQINALNRMIHFLDFILSSFLKSNDAEYEKTRTALAQLKHARETIIQKHTASSGSG